MFIKNGDEQPITETYDDDGITNTCPKCGKKMINFDFDRGEFVCDCELGDDDE